MRTTCRSCGSSKLQDIVSLGDQYLSEFTAIDDPVKPQQHPLDLVLCAACSLLQLRHTAPSDQLYTDNYGYRSGINNTIRADLKDIATKAWAKANAPFDPSPIVVDIGCNDGTLLSNYPDYATKVGFDPVAKFAKDASDKGITFINDYFNAIAYRERLGDRKATIVSAISMFYDLEDPNTFVADIVSILDPAGVVVIQQNYLATMLQNLAFDNVVHEHLEYFSLTSLEPLLARHGLEIVDVEQNTINGGSFRIWARHMNAVDRMRQLERNLRLDNKWTYVLFGMQINQARKKLHRFVKDEVAKGKTVYVYGASTRGNTLLQYAGLDHTLIAAAVERNPEKWGKKIASLDIPIISEEQAREEKPDYMLVLPWFFKEEFLKREQAYLEAGGHFIFPLPELEIV